MATPQSVTTSSLYIKLAEDAELLSILLSLRKVVEALASTTLRTVPSFTDHTIRHMDALWTVSSSVLTSQEIESFTPAEAFLLASAFYLHDIGMAYAATEVGLQKIKSTASFIACAANARRTSTDETEIERQAICVAVRQTHAEAANELSINQVPGTSIYLFEAQSTRDEWGRTCGLVASSHHWSISTLEAKFGLQGMVPLPGGRKGDLLYVSACLRIIDYAHINRERASTLDRAFRLPLGQDSLVHWQAQENINGPARERDELIYRASNPITNVDAWWLYYEMLTGLDAEIRAVRRLLDQRNIDLKRISLTGVNGAGSPELVSRLIPTNGFLPIEINLRTGSIDRLVELLAGETLYGPNPMAAVREIVQNARDAVTLKAEVTTHPPDKAALLLPIKVNLSTQTLPPRLEITDYGIGMSKRVLTDFLISIASNYWVSQFAVDYPTAAEKGFHHAC